MLCFDSLLPSVRCWRHWPRPRRRRSGECSMSGWSAESECGLQRYSIVNTRLKSSRKYILNVLLRNVESIHNWERKVLFFKQEEDTVNNYWLNKYEMVVRTVAVGLLKFHICKYLIYFVFKQVFRLSIFICTCLRCLYWGQIFLLRHVCFYCCFQSGNVVFHCLLKWKHYLDKYGLFYLKHFQTHFYIGINPQRAVSWT